MSSINVNHSVVGKKLPRQQGHSNSPSGGSFQGEGQIGLLLEQLRSH